MDKKRELTEAEDLRYFYHTDGLSAVLVKKNQDPLKVKSSKNKGQEVLNIMPLYCRYRLYN